MSQGFFCARMENFTLSQKPYVRREAQASGPIAPESPLHRLMEMVAERVASKLIQKAEGAAAPSDSGAPTQPQPGTNEVK